MITLVIALITYLATARIIRRFMTASICGQFLSTCNLELSAPEPSEPPATQDVHVKEGKGVSFVSETVEVSQGLKSVERLFGPCIGIALIAQFQGARAQVQERILSLT